MGILKFRIDSQTEERLARLLEGSTAETNGDVLKYALATYEMLLEARKKGHQILIREPEEDAKFILPGTPEAPTLTIVGDD